MSDTSALAEKADLYASTRAQRLKLNREADKLEETEKRLKQEIIDELKASSATAIGGKVVTLSLTTKNEPSAKDFDKLYAHIRETGHFDLLYRRINSKAIKERMDQGVQVPGIEWFPVESLSISTN